MKAQHKEWVEKAVKEMVANVGKNTAAITYFSVIDEYGNVHINSNIYCHAGLSSPFGYNYKGKRRIALIVSRIQQRRVETGANYILSTDIVDKYLRWLTTKSAYRSVFAKRGGKAVREFGFVVARTDVPSNLLAGALVAKRQLSEHPWHVYIWHELVKNGVDPSIAFAHSFQAKTVNGFDQFVVAPNSGHTPWDGMCFTKKMATNFRDGVMVEPNGKYSKGHYSYSPVHNLWGVSKGGYGGPGPTTSTINMLKALAEKVRVQADIKPAVNPFKAKPLDREIVPTDKMCAAWAEILKEGYKDA